MSAVAPFTDRDVEAIDRIVAETGSTPDAVLPILHAIQERYHWLPPEALRRVCDRTRITPAAIAGVSTFYSRFRHKPAGKHIVHICHGTACHVKGTELVHDALRRHLRLDEAKDTSDDGTFTVERVGCVGCCTLAPVVQVGGVTYGHRTPESIAQTLADFLTTQELVPIPHANGRRKVIAPAAEFRISCDSCCVASGAGEVKTALERAAQRSGGAAVVKEVGCWGMCQQVPLVEVSIRGRQASFYQKVRPALAGDIIRRHVRPRGLLGRLRQTAGAALDRAVAADDSGDAIQRHELDVRDRGICEFLGPQKRIATEHSGLLDPLELDEYLAHHGFAAARKALAANNPADVIETIKASGLRGRGGAGFPTGDKWARTRASAGDVKYVICNGDEGDPGAFMDRMILESFPYRVIEGMIVASLAVGAREGIFYVRHEYPVALQRIRAAIPRCEARGLLGDDILGSGHSLRLRVVEGGGAFVCGEETALIASIEGGRGTPRLRPPFPAESGLWGRPTCINNVETYALVPWIIRHGAAEFAKIGTATSKGTKVFSLTGKVVRGGLIEVPMGVTLRQIVEEIGGGVADGRRFKAVQIGGPSGGCIPAALADLPVDYESLTQAGAIMGSGGLVVLDDSDCMVDIARYFLQFVQVESCGKCSFCRVGTKVMLDILNRLCAGQAKASDLAKLEELCATVRQGSLCGLGQTAPNPVISTLRYFRDEYEAHLQGRCPAGRCKGLIQYVVNDRCIGCTICAQNCPDGAIPMKPYAKHEIDPDKCSRCDICRSVCPEKAIDVV